MKNKIKNPLRKRVVRELLGDWRKYLVVFLFLVLTIGFVSGMYVANESMMSANRSGAEKYKLEYGHFELQSQADDALSAFCIRRAARAVYTKPRCRAWQQLQR